MAPAVRVRADTVLTRSLASGSQLAQFRQSTFGSFVAPTFGDAPSGTLIFGGLVGFEQVGATPNPLTYGRLLPLSRGVHDLAAMRRYAPAGSFVAPTFVDAQTGTLVFGGLVPFEQLGGTPNPLAHGRAMPLLRGIHDLPAMRRYVPVGSFAAPTFGDSPTGALIFAGSTVAVRVFTDARSGVLILSGTNPVVYVDAVNGALLLSGVAPDHYVAIDPGRQQFLRVVYRRGY